MRDLAAEVAAIPKDLRIALMYWWRAHHHGGSEEQDFAEVLLNDAIGDRIEALRALHYGSPAEASASAAVNACRGGPSDSASAALK